MTELTLVATEIRDNEPCVELGEVERVSAQPGGGTRRFQIVRVVRNDRIYEHVTDMGPAKDFKTEIFIIPGAVGTTNGHTEVLETVGHVRGLANEYRAKFDKPMKRTYDPTDFVKAFEEIATRRRQALLGQKVFAAGSSQ